MKFVDDDDDDDLIPLLVLVNKSQLSSFAAGYFTHRYCKLNVKIELTFTFKRSIINVS